MIQTNNLETIRHLLSDEEALLSEVQKAAPDRHEEAVRLFTELQKKEGRWRSHMLTAENAGVLEADAAQKKRSFSVQGWIGGRGTFGARVMNPRVKTEFETGSQIESRQREAQDLADWKPADDGVLAKAEKELLDAADAAERFLEGIPGMDAFRAGYEERLHERKYSEACRFAQECEPGMEDYIRGMEYFLRLEDYRDSKARFDECSRRLWRSQAKARFFSGIKIALMLTLMFWVVGEMFGWFRGAPGQNALLRSIGISLRVGLLYVFPLLTVLLQCWALAEQLLRRVTVGRLVFSGGETDWP